MFYRNYENLKRAFILQHKRSQEELGDGKPLRAGEANDGKVKHYYTFNQTGNIMISSTAADEKDIQPDVRDVFKKVSVFFGAWTAALAKAGKNLYDHDAIENIIRGSGFFVAMHEEDRMFKSSATQMTLNTAIISEVLGSVDPMVGAMKMAQRVIDSIGKELRAQSSAAQTERKVAHLLFICENLMGMPIVSVSLFYTSSKKTSLVTKSNCHEKVSQTVSFDYHQSDYMFVDPDLIKQFTSSFESNPEYDDLINRLAELAK